MQRNTQYFLNSVNFTGCEVILVVPSNKLMLRITCFVNGGGRSGFGLALESQTSEVLEDDVVIVGSFFSSVPEKIK